MEKKDEIKLIELVLVKGNIDRVSFDNQNHKELFLERYGIKDEYLQASKIKIEGDYSNNFEEKKILNNALFQKREEIKEKAEAILSEKGIEIPITSAKDKINEIRKALEVLGIPDENIKDVLKNRNSLNNEEEIIITFKDDDNIVKKLDENGIMYERTKKGLEVNSKIILQEGFEVENNEENKKKLEKHNITYFQKEDKGRNLFVPLQAKKTAMLFAGTLMIGFAPALLLQIALNQSKILDKAIDNHLLTLSQRKALNNGETIRATQRENGKDVEQFLFRDKITGQIKRVNVSDLNVPNKINGVELSYSQMDELKRGNRVAIGLNQFKIDLNEHNGIKKMYKEMISDKEFQNIPKPEDKDEIKLKYIALKGAIGIDDIYGKGGANKEKDSFLEKYGIKDEYSEYKEYEKDYKLAKLYGEGNEENISKEMKHANEKIKDVAYDININNSTQYKR